MGDDFKGGLFAHALPLATADNDWSDLFAIVVLVVGTPLILIGVPIFLLTDGLKTFCLRALGRCFLDIRGHEHHEPGDVCFRYHTYRGFLLWVVQSEHVVIAPLQDAECLLGRLLRYNLTWGLLSNGMLFVPLLAYGNYLAQKRSIRQQAATSSDVEIIRNLPRDSDE